MIKHLPIRSKIEIAQKTGELLACLHKGHFFTANHLIEDLKRSSLYLEDPIQQDVLMLSQAIQFQEVYDPTHCITLEIKRIADRLIEDLGFVPPKD